MELTESQKRNMEKAVNLIGAILKEYNARLIINSNVVLVPVDAPQTSEIDLESTQTPNVNTNSQTNGLEPNQESDSVIPENPMPDDASELG